ncbi:Kelch repeat-containing protein [Apiospora hydei]|uniref:Kelch repeat-containing protein n=1 Tax=Apiospora hydei TaxID=1337664 RepID=A0ABR1W7X6_9PEZI
MSWLSIAWLAVGANLALIVDAQASGWVPGQVNATICQWQAPRVASIKDTVYMDGGNLFWFAGMNDGSYGLPMLDGNPLGIIYTLNFSRPFNVSQNVSSLFEQISLTGGGTAANSFAPNYLDGAMLANDNEFFLYGGLTTKSAANSDPPANEVIVNRFSPYGSDKPGFKPGFDRKTLPDGMTRYVTFGGAANSPSENKAWYFGGMRSPSAGPIYVPRLNNSLNPVNVSDTLITLDMTTQYDESWTKKTLPDAIKGRASPELLWVPVGAQGYPRGTGRCHLPGLQQWKGVIAERGANPSFMSDIDIYDIANDKWYKQPTIAGPGQLARGCAVVAVAQDYSSYNIYYYGGYDGLHEDSDFNDDVWILSLPSFMWMKIASGKTDHARTAHKCVTPYPDQMMVIGGYPSLKGGNTVPCLKDNQMIQLFNLTEGKWMNSYDPASYHDYGVPEMIHLMIGGDFKGSATMTVPTPSGWSDQGLQKVFETKYPTSKLTHYYPYTPDHYGNGTRPNFDNNNGLPSWVAPVLGVVLGLVFITAVVVLVMLYRRRKLLRNSNNMSARETDENGNRILSWIRGQDSNGGKAPTVTTSDDNPNLDDIESRNGAMPPHSQMAYTQAHAQSHLRPEMAMVHHEMPDTPLVELMDTSPALELSDTGLTPVEVINKHTHFGRAPHSTSTPTNPSSLSHYTVSQDHGSISSNSAHRGVGSVSSGRPDSPALGGPGGSGAAAAAAAGSQQNGPSRPPPEVSNLSRGDAAHLRNTSDASVSSIGVGSNAGDAAHQGTRSNAPSPDPVLSPLGPGGGGGTMTMGSVMPSPSPPLPVSPPSTDEQHATDYLSVVPNQGGRNLTPAAPTLAGTVAGGAVPSPSPPPPTQPPQSANQLRRSYFHESADDLGERAANDRDRQQQR